VPLHMSFTTKQSPMIRTTNIDSSHGADAAPTSGSKSPQEKQWNSFWGTVPKQYQRYARSTSERGSQDTKDKAFGQWEGKKQLTVHDVKVTGGTSDAKVDGSMFGPGVSQEELKKALSSRKGGSFLKGRTGLSRGLLT